MVILLRSSFLRPYRIILFARRNIPRAQYSIESSYRWRLIALKLNPMEIYNLLPKTNCRLCEPKTCMAFATKLALGDISPDDCPPLLETKFEKNLARLREMVAPMHSAEATGIKLDEDKCTGCNNCVVVCPVDASVEPPTCEGKAAMSQNTVFRVENGISKIINLEKCRRFPPDRLNCRVCEQYCCTDAIEIW